MTNTPQVFNICRIRVVLFAGSVRQLLLSSLSLPLDHVYPFFLSTSLMPFLLLPHIDFFSCIRVLTSLYFSISTSTVTTSITTSSPQSRAKLLLLCFIIISLQSPARTGPAYHLAGDRIWLIGIDPHFHKNGRIYAGNNSFLEVDSFRFISQ